MTLAHAAQAENIRIAAASNSDVNGKNRTKIVGKCCKVAANSNDIG